MRLSDIMSVHVVTATPEEPVPLAWTRMQTKGIRHLVVVDNKDLVGVVSKGDLGGRRGPHQGVSVGEVMSHPVVAVAPSTTVKRAANLMRGRELGCLPIVDGKAVVGIVTTTDLLNLLGREVVRPTARAKRFTLTHRHAR